MILLFLVLVCAGHQDFLEMVETQTKQGYTWEHGGRTVLTDEIALPTKEQDGTLVYYWYLTEPNNDKDK